MSTEMLNIVDDNDQIIGVEERSVIHEKGLLHREVHVYFVTPDNELIFQHRSKDKDTYPDLLDATVGGHVEIGDSYIEAALKETWEETGVKITATDLILVGMFHNTSTDGVTNKINHAFQSEYIYRFSGNISDLSVESGKSQGFEAWPIDTLMGLDEADKARFIPVLYEFMTTTLKDFIYKI